MNLIDKFNQLNKSLDFFPISQNCTLTFSHILKGIAVIYFEIPWHLDFPSPFFTFQFPVTKAKQSLLEQRETWEKKMTSYRHSSPKNNKAEWSVKCALYNIRMFLFDQVINKSFYVF